jgi:hypothetical protein
MKWHGGIRLPKEDIDMSNEWKDWQRDRSEEAKEWVKKYPFLRFKNNDCCPWQNTEEVKSCWMFDLPVGWYGIGAQMCDELMTALGKYADDFVILQLKEKFNEIRLYYGWADREYTDEESDEMHALYDGIENVIRKYAEISYNTCVVCGKPATKVTYDYIAGYCDECYKRFR